MLPDMAAAIDSLTITMPEWTGTIRHHFVWIGSREGVAAWLATAIGEFASPLGTPIYAFG